MSASSVAQENTTFSGRLIDTEGNPIPSITIYVRHNKGPNQDGSEGPDDSLRTVTDAKGRFAFPDIVYDPLKLEIDGTSRIGYQINVLSVEFGEIALHPDWGWHWSSVNFALEPGVKMGKLSSPRIQGSAREFGHALCPQMVHLWQTPKFTFIDGRILLLEVAVRR